MSSFASATVDWDRWSMWAQNSHKLLQRKLLGKQTSTVITINWRHPTSTSILNPSKASYFKSKIIERQQSSTWNSNHWKSSYFQFEVQTRILKALNSKYSTKDNENLTFILVNIKTFILVNIKTKTNQPYSHVCLLLFIDHNNFILSIIIQMSTSMSTSTVSSTTSASTANYNIVCISGTHACLVCFISYVSGHSTRWSEVWLLTRLYHLFENFCCCTVAVSLFR